MAYDTAHDLPSFVELTNQLKALKLIRFLLPKDKRSELQRLEAQIKELADTVDGFYALLGDRHWIYHDTLSVEKVRVILTSNSVAEDAEQQFIALYDPEFFRFALMRCNGFEELRKRRHLIEKARDDYFAGRYYACVFLLLSIADGFVNEFESIHRGLHTRMSEELSEWDSPISLHKGIGSVRNVVFKRITLTRTEPVEELYRHGIMHGTVLDFDNIIVATKAWNLLFAVMDWATAKTKAAAPKPPEKTWKEVFNQIVENDKDKKLLAAWSPYELRQGEAGFEEDAAFVACTEYLEAWKKKNYGAMSNHLSSKVTDSYGKSMPGVVREEYAPYTLEDFAILALNHTAAALCVIEAKIKVADLEEHTVTLRWLYESTDGKLAMQPKGNGEWRLMSWGVYTFLR
ncbi:MAG TPA: hypothetical protein VKT82_21615 [Ktedonobacterales bacterium]|nr:hypothetical protein [Ktedonobacterales bacterium]